VAITFVAILFVKSYNLSFLKSHDTGLHFQQLFQAQTYTYNDFQGCRNDEQSTPEFYSLLSQQVRDLGNHAF